ncbi:VOC family protein [Pseudomonas sp. LS2P72]
MFARSKLVPELMVSDIQKSLHFWTSLIGFQIAYERPEVGFAYLDQNGVQIMLEQFDPAEGQWVTGALQAPFGRGINFQITVDVVEPILQRLADVGCPLFRPCADVLGCRGMSSKSDRDYIDHGNVLKNLRGYSGQARMHRLRNDHS